jgi:hypothetical protein
MLTLKYEFITYVFILYISWCEERTERLILDSADAVAAEWEVVDEVGEMVNASTSTTAVPELNAARFRGRAAEAGCVTDSEGGGAF